MSLLSLHQQKTIKTIKTFLAKDLKYQYIGMNIKQKMRTKIQQTIAEAFLNQTLWKLPDCLFLFIQTKIIVLNDLILKSIINEKGII